MPDSNTATVRYVEIEGKIAVVYAGRVVDGDPAAIEQSLILGSD